MKTNITLMEIRKYLLWVAILLIIYLAYNSGRLNGYLLGYAIAVQYYNSSLCEHIDHTKDSQGYCIFEHKYNLKLNCTMMDIRLNGSETINSSIQRFAVETKNLIYKPILGCTYNWD